MSEPTADDSGLNPKQMLQRVADAWAIDPGKVRWDADGPQGSESFSWWPGDFHVKAIANQHAVHADPAVRIRIDTDFIRGLALHDGAISSLLANMAHFHTSTYAWVYTPTDLHSTLKDQAPTGFDLTRLWLSTTGYIREETSGWLPEFLARMAVLQPINAQIQSEDLSRMLKAEPDASSDPAALQAGFDEILGVLGQFIIPAGQEPSRWDGCEEFSSFAEKWGRSDTCFGTGDPTGLALETPFGGDSILIRLATDQAHPQLGNGLLATLQLPLLGDDQETAKLTSELNYLEAIMWTGFPLLGCWHARKVGENSVAAFSLFIPNALQQPMIATNVAFWMLQRARWAKNTRFGHLVDLPMIEILEQRLGSAG